MCVTSNFTFLTGASHPEELALRAAELGLDAIAITDRNSLAGVVRAYSALERVETRTGKNHHGSFATSHQPVFATADRQSRTNAETMPKQQHMPKLIVGARLVLSDCPVQWLALPTDRNAYHRLATAFDHLANGGLKKANVTCSLADLETMTAKA